MLDAGRAWPPNVAARRPPLMWFARQLGRASLVTIELAALSFPLAMALGLALAVGRLYGPRWLAWPLGGYVELIRGTPLLLQLLVIYYLLPYVGIRLDAFFAAVLGLALNYAAYEAEIYRAGLLSVPRGQQEAALSLGMSGSTALRRILLPQAVRTVIPPVTNDFIAPVQGHLCLLRDRRRRVDRTLSQLRDQQPRAHPRTRPDDGVPVPGDELPAVAAEPSARAGATAGAGVKSSAPELAVATHWYLHDSGGGLARNPRVPLRSTRGYITAHPTGFRRDGPTSP